MKHLKTYKNTIKDEPQIGNYVICEDSSSYIDNNTRNFIKNNIGQYILFQKTNHPTIFSEEELLNDESYIIQYKNIPENINKYFGHYEKNCRKMKRSEIIHFSKNKKNLQIYIDQNKYNL